MCPPPCYTPAPYTSILVGSTITYYYVLLLLYCWLAEAIAIAASTSSLARSTSTSIGVADEYDYSLLSRHQLASRAPSQTVHSTKSNELLATA